MCKQSVFISLMVLLTVSSLTLADITQAQSSHVGVSSTDPVTTNWAVSQYANGDPTTVGTQTQTINVYTSSSDSDSPFLAGHLPSSLLKEKPCPKVTTISDTEWVDTMTGTFGTESDTLTDG